MALSQTNLCNKRPFPVKSVPYEHAQWSAAINALIIVASLSDSLCSASVRQRGKGVSERSELVPCWGEPERAPHRRVERSQSIYIYIYIWWWYVRHPRAAIYIVQQLAIYSGGRMKKLLRSPVPRAQSLLSQQNRLP